LHIILVLTIHIEVFLLQSGQATYVSMHQAAWMWMCERDCDCLLSHPSSYWYLSLSS